MIYDDDEAAGGRGDDLFVEQRATSALDQPQVGVDFVGAVNCDVDFRNLIECHKWDAQTSSEILRPSGGRNASDLQPSVHTLSQELYGERCCRAGAQSDSVAVIHKAKASSSSGCLFSFECHIRRID
jgi:hypothetical protein